MEISFTYCQLVKLWWEVVNLKNEIDKKEATRLFGEEFHTLGHIFLCIENTSGLKLRNGHIKFLMVFAKLVGIIPILACQDPFYRTSSIPNLLRWHVPLFDITTMLFGYFMGLLMVFIDFNFF